MAKLIEAVKDVFDQSANEDEMISWYISCCAWILIFNNCVIQISDE